LKHAGLIIIALVAVAAGLVAGATPAHAAVYTVNSTYGGPIPPATTPPATDFDPSDGVCETGPGNGICTLRAAIEQANSPTSLGLDTIAFNIPTSDPGYDDVTKAFLIQPSSALPVIADPVIIDGRTQPQFAGEAGADCTDADDDDGDLAINDGCPQAGATAESGLECANDVNDDSPDDTLVNDGCPTVLGADTPVIELNGLFAGSLVDGLRITAGGSGSTIRGLVIVKFGITNNSDAIEIQGGGNNTIEGNFIGVQVNGIVTDPDPFTGGDEYGNLGSGIYINNSSNNVIGGARTDETCVGVSNPCNVISGGGRGNTTFNDAHGVEIFGSGSTGNVIKGNIIGLDAGAGESGYLCLDNVDNDGDGFVNDGCPQVGANAESGAQCANALNDDLGDDAVVNDGCPAVLGARKDLGNEGDGVNISGGASNNWIGGAAAGEGNVISGNDGYGVRITGGASGNHLEGNYIGTTSTGLSIPPPPASKQIFGVLIDGAPSNFIGGTATGAGNLVSGNLIGVQVQGASSTGNLLRGNYIGTDLTGGSDLGNIGSGIIISNGASNNTIGGTAAGAGNVISGNNNHGIEINSSTSTGNVVQGNFIGTDAAGTAEIGNGSVGGASTGRGIRINGAPGNTIGGSSAARNVISGNVKYGIEIINGGATGNIVQSNYIGTNPTATAPVGNREAGIYVDGAPNTIIGGTTTDLRNIISGNGQASVLVVAQGIVLTGAGASGAQVRGNLIGTDVNGTAPLSNLGIGVLIIGAPTNTIGGTAAGARNIISGNGIHGVEIDAAGAAGNLVQGNHIGMDINGSVGLGNAGDGVFISDAPGNIIGGGTAGAANVISANGQAGVHILGVGASANMVRGNFIGTDAAGGLDRGNSQHGVWIDGAPNTLVGGTSAAARNVISGNNATGVTIQDPGAAGNLVRGNRIGTNAAGNAALGNTSDGVRIGGNASNNSIGGTAAGATNSIAYNGAGVVIDSGTGNSVLSNSIHSNTTLGINLGLDGVTANDAGDADSGANNLQNFPVLSSANSSSSSTTIVGTLNSAANTTFILQFFASAACDASGFGEGESFLGSFSVTTNGSGNASFNPATVSSGGVGTRWITATATDPNGNTSEFSQCNVQATGTFISPTPTPPPPSPPPPNPTGYYHPVTPARILDTRTGPGPVGAVGPGGEITVDVTGVGTVPANPSEVSAVVVNATVTGGTANSFLTVYPTGVSRPTASNLNFGVGQTVPNLVTVKVGADGYVKVYNEAGQTHVIFDVLGWYGLPAGGSRFNSLPPARILDTRTSPQGSPPGKLAAGATVSVQATGVGGVPPLSSGVTAVVVNATVTEPTKASYLTVYPTGVSRPTASNLNFGVGQTVPNLVAVKVGTTDGKVNIFNAAGETHVIFDVVGWYGAASGDIFNPVTPARVLDTRTSPQGIPAGAVGNNSQITVDVTGVGGVPTAEVSAVVVNTTATQPTAPSYLTVFPSDLVTPPTASNLNFVGGQTVPNLVMVKAGADGNVKVYNAIGQVHVIFDVVGYFGPP